MFSRTIFWFVGDQRIGDHWPAFALSSYGAAAIATPGLAEPKQA
jgi:hypothetical protein